MRRIEKREPNNISNDSSCARVFRAHFDGGFSPMPRQVVTSFCPHSHARTGTHLRQRLNSVEIICCCKPAGTPLVNFAFAWFSHCSIVLLYFETFRCI